MEITKRLLFIDDIRYPIDVYHYTKQDIYLRKDWHIVRNYEQFTKRILEYGLPEMISFDHDLADEHYLEPNSQEFVEKTGYDCAKWLINYCMDNYLDLPEFYCHSMNPVGKENIESLLKNFKNIKETTKMKPNIFFTADHHFGHENIIKFSERPFESLDQMNEELIQRWNEKVGTNDVVYHLGDISLGKPDFTKEVLDRLNGNIHLIKGNHEGAALTYPKRFKSIIDYHELRIDEPENSNGKQKIILFHYAMRTWNGSHRGIWQLYGHSHGTLPDDEMALSFDVGVDCHNFYPVSYEEVKEIMKKKKWTPPFAPRN